MALTILEINKRIRSIDIEALMIKAVEINKDAIIKLNKGQLLKGLNAKGQKITPKYKRDKDGNISKYAIKKNIQNAAPGLETPDLFLSGLMFSEMDLITGIPSDKEYSITSFVEYLKFLIPKYGDVFNLTKESLKEAKILVTNTYKVLWKQRVFG